MESVGLFVRSWLKYLLQKRLFVVKSLALPC